MLIDELNPTVVTQLTLLTTNKRRQARETSSRGLLHGAATWRTERHDPMYTHILKVL